MKYLEHRRHALRNKPFPHLNQKGVSTAQEVGKSMGRFEMVVTSIKPRAAETGVAMGHAITHESELLHIEPTDIESSINWDLGFKAIIDSESSRLKRFMSKLRHETMSFLERLPEEKSVLFLSHGGMIELHLLSLIHEPALVSERPLDKCEGWRLKFDKGEFKGQEIIRIN